MRRTPENDAERLRHMLAAAREADQMVRTHSKRTFSDDRGLQLAVEKLVQNTGEAANNLTFELRLSNPQAPWAKIIGMRHRLVHAYHQVDHLVLWDTVLNHIPPLIRDLERMLEGAEEK